MRGPCHPGVRGGRPALLLVLLSALLSAAFLAAPASAQTGVVVGSVRDGTSGTPLSTVEVRVLDASGERVAQTLTTSSGIFRIRDLPVGTYSFRFSLPGWEVRTERVRVTGGGAPASVEVELTEQAINLNPITVTASKREEKTLEAPAAVEVVPTREIAEQPAVTLMDHVKKYAAVDVIKTGIQGNYVVVRGFNNVFSGATLTLTDNRIARVPSLRANISHLNPTTNADVERIEVVLGPGSALYGPNAANGVIHSITKSPIDQPGGTFSVANGIRQQGATPGFGSSDEWVGHVEGRIAHQWAEEFGVKLSGQYFKGTEFFFRDPEEASQRELAEDCIDAGFSPTAAACQNFAQGLELGQVDDVQTLISSVRNVARGRDEDVERWTADVRADWRPNLDTEVIFSAGRTQAIRSVDLTGLGAAQVKNWAYSYVQGRVLWNDAFAQVFWNKSQNDDSYLLRSGRPLVDESSLLVAQLQNSTRGADWANFIYGLDLLRTVPRTEGTINGQNEDDDDITEVGGYVQGEFDVGEKWDLVSAFRLDNHSRLDDPVFSPRAAVVYQADARNTLRMTYNRAFSTPTTLNLFLDISGGTVPLGPVAYDVRAQGTTESGFTFSRTGPGNRPDFQSPFNQSPFPDVIPGGPRAFVPTTTENLWNLMVAVVGTGNPDAGQLLASLPTPDESQVGIDLRTLNIQDQQFLTTPGGFSSVADAVPPVDPQITNTLEVGYKGFLGDRLLVAGNVYYSRISDFISALRVNTPNVFLNRDDVEAYLESFGVPAEQAEGLATSIGGFPGDPDNPGIPLGVITPEQAGGSDPALVLTYQNLGDVDLWGADVTLDLLLSDRWELRIGGAWVSDDQFDSGEELVPLNAATLKGSLGIRYRNQDAGFNGQLRARAVNSFPANSGVYVGDVAGHGVVDLTLGYEIPGYRQVTAQLDVQNVLDNSYQTFVGAPELGRFILLRLKYDF